MFFIVSCYYDTVICIFFDIAFEIKGIVSNNYDTVPHNNMITSHYFEMFF